MIKETVKTRELRVREFPEKLHLKIERYISLIHSRTGRELNKQTATIELLEKSTKSIKLIQA